MTPDRWEQIFALFEATLRQPLSEREAFLARQCGDDAELGAEVRTLLVTDSEAESFLSRGRRPAVATVVDSRPALPGLSAGMQLGVFRIESFIGAGGMGEVYKALDTRLDRHVAIKVLSLASATDPRGRARFAYEARAVGRLSHPRICALYDIGHHDGVDFLVMEYLQGETLAARLRRGTLPLAEALRIGVEIAEALDAAHAQGIVHRDLKPANVMITADGTKLLDFGLARLRAAIGSDTAATFTRSQTEAGLIVGTLQYMSPEQLEGKEVDARTDIFAFGAVLYELVTATKAFAGESQASLISAILSSEPPPIAGTQPLSPPTLDRLVRTCLEKDRDKRWASIHDVLLQLRWTAQEKPTGGGGTDSSSRKRVRAPWLVAAAAVLLGTSALLWSLRRPPVAGGVHTGPVSYAAVRDHSRNRGSSGHIAGWKTSGVRGPRRQRQTAALRPDARVVFGRRASGQYRRGLDAILEARRPRARVLRSRQAENRSHRLRPGSHARRRRRRARRLLEQG